MKKIQQFLVMVGLATFGLVSTANAELIIFEWGGYEDENFFPDYMAKYGKAPSYNFFSDEEEAFQKQVSVHTRIPNTHLCVRFV
jgi:spermidine/putrescine-binding protein